MTSANLKVFESKLDLDSLVCNICTNYFNIPTFKCPNGHPICKLCCKKTTSCPFCRSEFNNPPKRAADIERELKIRLFPCRNELLGCTKKLKRSQVNEHERNCSFAVIRCPTFTTDCPEMVKLKDLGKHLSDAHKCQVSGTKLCSSIEISDFYQNRSIKEFFFEKHGRKLFVSFAFSDDDYQGLKNVVAIPLEIQADPQIDYTDVDIIINVREKKTGERRKFTIPVLVYKNQFDLIFSNRKWVFYNEVKKQSDQPKAMRFDFNFKVVC